MSEIDKQAFIEWLKDEHTNGGKDGVRSDGANVARCCDGAAVPAVGGA